MDYYFVQHKYKRTFNRLWPPMEIRDAVIGLIRAAEYVLALSPRVDAIQSRRIMKNLINGRHRGNEM